MFENPYQYEAALRKAADRPKPVVTYRSIAGLPVIVGKSATVVPTDHPATYLNGRVTYTSDVESVGPDGSFETRNTRYVLARD